MLRQDGEPKQWAFADQARAVRAVPADHVLMRMRRTVDWAAAERELAGEYDPALGRPSWPPAMLLRMLVLGRSDCSCCGNARGRRAARHGPVGRFRTASLRRRLCLGRQFSRRRRLAAGSGWWPYPS